MIFTSKMLALAIEKTELGIPTTTVSPNLQAIPATIMCMGQYICYGLVRIAEAIEKGKQNEHIR